MDRPAKIQGPFSSGELDPLFTERFELKYFRSGLAHMENVQVHPQGGFSVRDGLRRIGAVDDDANRLLAFTASTGAAYDIVASNLEFAIWDADSETDTVTTPYTLAQCEDINIAQLLDTMIVFHEDVAPRRLKHLAADDWEMDTAPLSGIPSYDYGSDIAGDPYTNGVDEEWEIEFVGFEDGDTIDQMDIAFYFRVNGYETNAVKPDGVGETPTEFSLNQTKGEIRNAFLKLPIIHAGIDFEANSSGTSERTGTLTLSGAGNEGSDWAISGHVYNKPDAAIVCRPTVTGVRAGEDVISDDRGWPRCGAFYQQRLLMGGFKGLPNAWIYSQLGDYYNLDPEITTADGSALIPMDTGGGERIERIVAGRSLLILTNEAEFWLQDRTLDKTKAPNHVEGSRNGVKAGVPVVSNEGAAIYAHVAGGVISEFRYTDVEGNFTSIPLSLLSAHLFDDIRDMALRRAKKSSDANRLAVLNADDSLRMGYLLRDQEVTAFGRVTTDGTFKAVSVNGRNEMSVLVDRTNDGETERALERFEPGLLLDGAIDIAQSSSTTISGLGDFEGEEVWAIVDDDVLGPFTVESGEIDAGIAVTAATVGRWTPLKVKTMPFAREVAQGVFSRRPMRIAGVKLSLKDTTSIAIGIEHNGVEKDPKDVPLGDWGGDTTTPELQRGFTGIREVFGLTGESHSASLVITQTRPGRMTVRSIHLITD